MTDSKEKAPLLTSAKGLNKNNVKYKTSVYEKQVENDNKPHDFKKSFDYADLPLREFIDSIKNKFHCKIWREKDKKRDLLGIDYNCKRNGYKWTIDEKRRKAGISKYWKNPDIPELTFELFNYYEENSATKGWSVAPEKRNDLYAFTYEDLKGFKFFACRIFYYLTILTTEKLWIEENRKDSNSIDSRTGKIWKTENTFASIPEYLLYELRMRFALTIPKPILKEYIQLLQEEYQKPLNDNREIANDNRQENLRVNKE